ncbi:hypothetical protein R4Z10_06080 [Niallia sp. XMNu-256]|uniref:hypothetical protein n=1 Tax=Niallia sp. XMNu-256 TaxID=3082444 RepID=UPI0030D54516
MTYAGTVFLKDAREIIKKLDESLEQVQQAEDGYIGIINIGLLSTPVRELLPKINTKI